MTTADGHRQEGTTGSGQPSAQDHEGHANEEITPRVLIFFDYA
jgi:hypothetical protein